MHHDKMPDEELAEYGATGDHNALTELVRRYYGFVLAWFRKRLPERAAADAAQEAFAKLLQKLPAFDQTKASFKTWLIMSICRSAGGSIYRKARIQQQREISLNNFEDKEDSDEN